MTTEPIRILRIAASTYPEVVGGVGLHVHHMSRMQANMGHDVTVVTSDNGDRSLPREERRAGYRLIRHREVARPMDNTITPGIITTLRRNVSEYDVLHIHSHLYFSSNVAAMVSRLSDIPTVVTNHGLISQTAPTWLQHVFNPTLGKFTFEVGDSILCYTETNKRRLEERGIETDISVIPNGIDCSQFKPTDAESNHQLLFVGRLKDGKGPHYLLDAFGRLATAYPGLSLTLVGDGPLRSELETQAAQLGVSDRVEFLGEVPNDELPRLYNESLAFVLPSLSEGLPRTVLEAMACGTPVVTSDLEQLRPIVDGVGYTAEPGSPADLRTALDDLLQLNGTGERFGERARKRVEQQYSWETTVEKTVREYREIMNANKT